jgi:hypothetical protein
LVSLVVPDARHFSWNQREGWEIAFRKAGISFFCVGVGPKPTRSQLNQIFRSDLAIFLNDHHLEPLFSTLGDPANRFSKNSDGLWIGVSTERVENSPFPRSVEKTRQAASFCQFTAFFDRSAEPVIRSAGSMPFFIHQYVDHHTFRSEQPYPAKKPQVFWTGKLPAGHTQGEYGVRTRLFESVRDRPGFAWREAYKPDLSIQQAVRERDGFQGLLHLPSNCPGYTSTFFENLAMGGCVIQYDAGPEYALADLKAGEHYLSYDANRPETLLEAVETFLRDPGTFQKMAEEGRRLCLKNHTIQQRLFEIFQFVAAHLGRNGVPGPDSKAGKAVAQIIEKLQTAKQREVLPI